MALAAKEMRELREIGWHELKLPTGTTTAQAIATLSHTPGIDKVEPNFIRHITQFVPTDPYYPLQYGPRLIGCEQGWNLTLGANIVTIGFVDTGIDLNNAEFSGRLKVATGSNLVANNSTPADDNDHGTHVAGIATAALNNSVGIAGVCPKATILPVKALDSSGSGTVANIAAGYMFAANNGADIVNASLGGTGASQTEQDAVNYVLNQGKLFVAAAGNSGDQGNQLFYPAAYPGAIGVGAVDSTGTYTTWSQYGSWVKVAAPGVHIYSTYPNGQYAYDDGTSMSSPHVAGALALLKSYAPTNTSNQQIENALFAGCTTLGSNTQYGLINVYNSLNLLTGSNTSVAINPFAANSYAGTLVSGTANSLASVDSNFLIVNGANQADGTQLAGYQCTFLLTHSLSSLVQISVNFAAEGTAASTGYIYAFNFLKGRYDLVTKEVLSTNLTRANVLLRSPKPYVRAGELRLVVLASAAAGPPFTLTADQTALAVTTNGGP
jgi:thermitase